MKRLLYTIAIVIASLSSLSVSAQEVVNLSGAWDFCVGETPLYQDQVVLPGSMLTNGKGDPVSLKTQWTGSLYDSSFYFNPYLEKYRQEGNLKFPFFLTPERHYVGVAWYRRSVYVPASWEKRRVTLFLERPHIETTVFVNGHEVGHQMSLSTPHTYDVTKYLVAGQRNTIAVKVYNGIENVCVGQDSHSVTDQTQGNWNGIIGRMELRAQPRSLYINKVRVHPHPYRKTVGLEVEVDGQSPDFGYYGMQVLVQREGCDTASIFMANYDVWARRMSFEVKVPDDAMLWDEFHPNCYRLAISVGDDYYETTFGMREVGVVDRQIFLNRHPIFLRGTVENCCFPETGYPPTDEASWLRIFQKMKD